MAKRYANLKSFTQSYPNPRGGSTCFRPGECQTGHWWSRFATKEGGLTEVSATYNPSRDFKPFGPRKAQPVISPRIIGETTRVATGCSSRCDSACQIACESKCELACENTKQTIQVTNDYEKVGADFYCRHCDWSTRDPRRVEEHIEAYHPEMQQVGPEEGVGSGSWSESQHAKDPGSEATTSGTGDRAVPAQSTPPPRTPKQQENVAENEYWSIIDGMFHCTKCQQECAVKWTTPQRAAMARHAKRHHGHVTVADRKKAKAKA